MPLMMCSRQSSTAKRLPAWTSRISRPARLQNVAPKQPFETVVAQQAATVLRVCRAVLGPVDADDAWSETFLSAMKAYPDLPADANVEAWLVTIAHRKAIDVTRAGARHATRPLSFPTRPRPPQPTVGTSTSPTHSRGYRPNRSRPSPITTSPACPTPTWPPSSAAALMPRDERRPMASPPSDVPIRAPLPKENPDDHPQ